MNQNLNNFLKTHDQQGFPGSAQNLTGSHGQAASKRSHPALTLPSKIYRESTHAETRTEPPGHKGAGRTAAGAGWSCCALRTSRASCGLRPPVCPQAAGRGRRAPLQEAQRSPFREGTAAASASAQTPCCSRQAQRTAAETDRARKGK